MEAAGLPYGATVVVITATLNQRLEQTLIDLRRREYAVVLLTLGETKWQRPMPNIQYHHLDAHLATPTAPTDFDTQKDEAWHVIESINLGQ
jgi:hypothetical protein